MNYDNPIKDFHRNASVTDGRTYRNIIDLCGPQMLSQKHLVCGRHLDHRSVVTIIERDRQHAGTIASRWKSSGLWSKPSIHVGDVESCPVSGEYDWVNLDTCSSFSLGLAEWISKVKFAKYGELNVWLTTYRSNTAFLNSLHKTFNKHCDTPNKLLAEGDDGEHPFLDFIDRDDRSDVLFTASGIAQSLNHYEYRIWPVRTYTHHRASMFLYRFTNILPKRKVTPSLSDILLRADRTNIKYESKKVSGVVGEFTKITDLLLLVAGGADNYWPYTASRMRIKIKENEMVHKTPKMTKAGWKSHISKIERDAEIRDNCHRLIERI